MRYAARVAYDGRRFHGSQIQPGLRTVEGDFLAAAEKLGIITDRTTFSRASRTDAGVSALGNVFVFSSDFRTNAIIPALNSRLKDIRICNISEVPESFNPRWATMRHYRYYLPYGEGFDMERAEEAISLFRGLHDFSSYTRDRDKNPEIEVSLAAMQEGNLVMRVGNDISEEILRFARIDISAPYFLWNMVRWIVGAVEAAGYGRIGVEDIVRSFSGTPLPSEVRIARPDLLLLRGIDYGGNHSAMFPEERACELPVGWTMPIWQLIWR